VEKSDTAPLLRMCMGRWWLRERSSKNRIWASRTVSKTNSDFGGKSRKKNHPVYF